MAGESSTATLKLGSVRDSGRRPRAIVPRVKALRPWLAFLAAAISCALGVASLLDPDRRLPRAPTWEGEIAPLASAPLPRGAVVVLLPQAGLDGVFNRFLLLEAAWRRPDVRWAPMPEFPADSRLETVVATDGRPAPPGWAAAWASGDLRVFQREAP